MSKRLQTIAIATVALAGLALGLAATQAVKLLTADAEVTLHAGVALHENPRQLPPFALVDHDGRPFGNTDLDGRWSLVFFGFTHCPDICPTTLTTVRDAVRQLPAGAPDAGLQVYFVSVDPERDTPEHLRRYTTFFDPDFKGLTGRADALDEFSASLGAVYRVEEHAPGATDYEVGHSAHIAVLDPRGRMFAVLTGPHAATPMAADLATIFALYDAG